MSNNMFPGQHTTTTTVTSTETHVNPTIRFDKEYLNSLSGQLKLVEIVSSRRTNCRQISIIHTPN